MKVLSCIALCAAALSALAACSGDELPGVLPSGRAVALNDLPAVRPGRWVMRTIPVEPSEDLSMLNSPATSDLLLRVSDAGPDVEVICVEPGATVLRATNTDLADCAQRSIRHVAAGYLVEARCESGVSSEIRALYSGDFQSVINADLEVGVAPKNQPMETVRVRIEGRRQGECSANER